MGFRSLPAAFGHLVDETNAAADAALVEVLPDLEPFAQATALEILLWHGRPSSLATVVGRFNDSDEGLQRLILARAGDLSAGVRVAIVSPSFQQRSGAIEVIVSSDAGRLAYLLADTLRSRCGRTRKLAALGLHEMTVRLLDRLGDGPDATETAELSARADGLAEALGTGVRRWEIHLQPKVLEAALWLGGRVEPAIREKLEEPRTKMARVLSDLLDGTSDPRLAGFVLRALAMTPLRSAAARAIARSRSTTFLRAVFMESWLLCDPRIEQGCRWIRDDRWLRTAVGALYELDESALRGAIRLLGAVGGPPERRVELFGELVGAGHPGIRRAVLWQLVRDGSEAAGSLLNVLAARPGDSVATIAAREARRRRPDTGSQATPILSSAGSERAATAQVMFDQHWGEFDDLGADEQAMAGDAIRRLPDVGLMLRARLASSEPLDRVRALRIALAVGLWDELEEHVQRLAHDPDPIVRSVAVSMLVERPGPTVERLLRSAVNDPDDRVAANAVEGLDRLDVADRVTLTVPKLKSRSSRVRANAVKSLLRAELRQAADVLVDMLDDSSAAHRISALWVIERFRSRVLLERLYDMSRDDPDPRVRKRAARVCRIVAPGAVPVSPVPKALREEDRVYLVGDAP